MNRSLVLLIACFFSFSNGAILSADTEKTKGYVLDIRKEINSISPNKIRYSALFYIEGNPMRLLLDTGGEAPVIDAAAMAKIDFPLQDAKSGSRQIANGLKIDYAPNDTDRPFGFRGPVYVDDLTRLRNQGISGQMPINLIAFYDCEITDFDAAEITILPTGACEEIMRSNTNHLKLEDRSSTTVLPYWTSTTKVGFKGQSLKMLVSTFATQSFVNPKFIEENDTTDIVIPKLSVDGTIYRGNELKPQCLSFGEHAVLLNNMAAFDEEYDYPVDGVLGTDFLRRGKLVYVGKDASYFVFGENKMSDNCLANTF